jgi:exosortase
MAATVTTPPPAVANAPQAELPLPRIAWFLALLVILFFQVLKPMVAEWAGNEDMGHAFFVPFVAGYVIWQERDRILAQPVKPCWPALLLVVWAFIQMMLGLLGADFFTARTAFLIAAVGVVWSQAGTAVLKTLIFPIVLLLFMIRLPLFVQQQLTFPLQIFASKVAALALEVIGIPVMRDGNVLHLPTKSLEVVEACSGIRSITSLAFLSLAYAYVFDHRKWMRPLLFVLTVPIAITANSARITLTGILTEYKPDWAEGVYHSMEGWVLFMIALAALMGTHRLICRFAGSAHV